MHFDFPLPFNSELKEQNLIPYKANEKLVEQVYLTFIHPTFKYNKLAYSTFTKYPYSKNQLAVLSIGLLRAYYQNPSHYGHSIENIQLQILVRMFKKLVQISKSINKDIKYLPTKQSLLKHTELFFDTLQETCEKKLYKQEHINKIPTTKTGYKCKEKTILYYESLDLG